MSRIHDMGGRFGDGAIPDKEDSTPFHKPWHAKAMAVTLASGALGAWSIDSSRHARERLAPKDYASFSYYEKWMAAAANLLVERGMVSSEELKTGHADRIAALSSKALRSDDVFAAMHKVNPYTRSTGPEAQFAVGDKVRTTSYNPNPVKGGHTRLPSYAMGRVGTIVRQQGNHVLPDSNAHLNGEAPEPLYAVEFTAAELWHQDAENGGDTMVLDLWQSYLEPAK